MQNALQGIRIVVTRARADSDILQDSLKNRGAEVIYFPTIRIEIIPGALDPIEKKLDRYDWIVFTSRHGAAIYLDEMKTLRPGAPPCGKARVAATGASTAEVLVAGGVSVDLIPEVSMSEGLVDALAATGLLNGSRFLLPRAAAGRDLLPQTLTQYGAEVDAVPLYDTVADRDHPPETIDRLKRGEADLLTFASPSAVHCFVEQVGGHLFSLPHITTAAIGPVTASAVRRAGGNPTIVPRKFDSRSLVLAIERWASERRM